MLDLKDKILNGRATVECSLATVHDQFGIIGADVYIEHWHIQIVLPRYIGAAEKIQ